MIFKSVALSVCVLGLGACAAAGTPPAPGQAHDTCDQAPGQAFIGQTATAETARELLRATHTRELRWVPPRTAVTMEYRFGRLTVGYDDAMAITRVSCG